MLKAPRPDPALDPFRGGVAVLRRDGVVAGHIATTVGTFWGPFSLTLRLQWWVWYIVVWADGIHERSQEDYPPWIVVREMQAGTFTWEQNDIHHGLYTVDWLPDSDREGVLADLGIAQADF